MRWYWIVGGVVGLMVSVWVSSSSVVIEGVGSTGGGGAGCRSSTNTRVGFGAVASQGKIGLGRSSFAGGVGVT